jgi:hypothetical protein
LWYYLIQPPSITDGSLGVEDRDGDTLPDVKIGLSDSCFFYVNYEGEIIDRQLGSACQGDSALVRIDEK